MNAVTTAAESTVPETMVHEEEPAALAATTMQVEENVGVRVKPISEINGHITTSSSSPTGTTKRKLPEWMLTQCAEPEDDVEQNSQIKKIKVSGISVEPASDAENVSNDQEETPPTASTSTEQFQVKKELPESTEDTEAQPCSSSSANLAPVKPAVKVEIADASSSSERESCKFGIRCYRRNQMHRLEEAHPGDRDYKRPSYLLPPLGTPDCPYGDRCYRRNPIHFQHYSHPANTDFEQNFRQYSMRLRRRQQNTDNNAASSDLDEQDLEDPFIDDSGSEYEPSNEEEETEDFMAGCDDAEE